MDNLFSKVMLTGLAASLIFVSCVNKQDNTESKVETEIVVDEFTRIDSVVAVTSATTLYPYKIIDKKESSFNLPDKQVLKKMTITVEIETELHKSALDEIANVIAKTEPYEYVFIEYYLATQAKNGPNYGLSKRTPTEQSTQINYVAPPAKESTSTTKTPYDGCKVYGKWNMVGATVIVYQKGNNCYMVNYYGGTNYGEPERFIKTKFKGRTAFKNAEDPADMYVINKYGDLEGYYEGDLACTFSKTL